MSDTATAFAPASIGNLAVGFDMLGLALEGAGDRVMATRSDEAGISVAEVCNPDGGQHRSLPARADENTASIAAQALWDAHGQAGGVSLRIFKGVPMQSGMGGSAASAVAATVAVNALLESPLETADLLPYALAGEKFSSGGVHADNVAPSLLGGLILCPVALMPDVIRLPVPEGLSSVLLHPDLQVNTAQSRRRLAADYSMDQWLTQQGYLAGFIAACASGDLAMMARTLKDIVIEPQRKAAVPCFDAVRDAAIGAGALGCSLSGSGPSIFALCRDQDAPELANAMEQACRGFKIESQSWISSMGAPGAGLES